VQDTLAVRYIKTVSCLRRLDDIYAQTTQPQLRRALADVVVSAVSLTAHAWHRLAKAHEHDMYDVHLVPALAPMGLLPAELEIPIPSCLTTGVESNARALVQQVLAAHSPRVLKEFGPQLKPAPPRKAAESHIVPSTDAPLGSWCSGSQVMAALEQWESVWNQVAVERLGSSPKSICRGSSIDAETEPEAGAEARRCEGSKEVFTLQPAAGTLTLSPLVVAIQADQKATLAACCLGDDHYVVPDNESTQRFKDGGQRSLKTAVKRVKSGGKAANSSKNKTKSSDQTQVQMAPVVHLLSPLSPARIRQVITLRCILPLLMPIMPHPSVQTLLLFGPPGVGKTALAHAISNEAQASMYDLTYDSVLRHVASQGADDGGSEDPALAVVSETFSTARRSDSASVILIENIETVFIRDHLRAASFVADKPPGTKPPCHIRQRLIEETRSLKPEHRVLVIGTSREPYVCVGEDQEALCEYFSDLVIPIGLPSYETRRKMLAQVTASVGWTVEWTDLSLAASATGGLSGKDLVVDFASHIQDKERIKQRIKHGHTPLLEHVLEYMEVVGRGTHVGSFSRPYPLVFDEWIARTVSKTQAVLT
jgi:hypothetical protein